MLDRLEHNIGEVVVGFALLFVIACIGALFQSLKPGFVDWRIGVRFRLCLTRRDWNEVVRAARLTAADGKQRELEDLDAQVCVHVLPPSKTSHGYKMGRVSGCQIIGWHLNNPQRDSWEARHPGRKAKLYWNL